MRLSTGHARLSSVMLPFAAIWLAGPACGGDSKVECACTDSALVVRIPPDRAASVIDVVPSGPACAGARVSCAETPPGGGPGCVRFSIIAVASGNCHLDVDFSSGPGRFSADLRLAQGSCCHAFYADPPSAGEIDVPSAGLDAGGAE